MKRRDKHDIAMTMLKAAKLPIQKTQLMYKARLSYDQLQRYLDLMIENGLIENCRIEGKRHNEILYKTTQKGLSFIENLESAEKLWETQLKVS